MVALRGVDITVKRGELLMLVGPSGCGKTTLISVIAGILDHDEGECRVFGQDFKAMRQRDRAIEREPRAFAAYEVVIAGRGDHRGVIGAARRRRHVHAKAVLYAGRA